MSRPASRACSPSTSLPNDPQIVLAMAPVTSSDSPMTLPTSRIADLGR